MLVEFDLAARMVVVVEVGGIDVGTVVFAVCVCGFVCGFVCGCGFGCGCGSVGGWLGWWLFLVSGVAM